MALTFAAIKNAKGRDKPYKLTDGDGLFLHVTPNGSRYWRMNYRYLGKQKTLAFGVLRTTVCTLNGRFWVNAARRENGERRGQTRDGWFRMVTEAKKIRVEPKQTSWRELK